MRLPRNSAQVDFENGRAVLNADLDVLDYTKLPNALSLGAAVPAAVTYEILWTDPITRDITVRDATNGFSGRFLENHATITWSATQVGFSFASDSANTSTTVFAELGRERNGIFF